MKAAKRICIIEIRFDGDVPDAQAVEEYQAKLDHFREDVGVAMNYGLTIYLADRADLERFGQAGCLLPNPGLLPVSQEGP